MRFDRCARLEDRRLATTRGRGGHDSQPLRREPDHGNTKTAACEVLSQAREQLLCERAHPNLSISARQAAQSAGSSSASATTTETAATATAHASSTLRCQDSAAWPSACATNPTSR